MRLNFTKKVKNLLLIMNIDKYIVFEQHRMKYAKNFCMSNIMGTLMFELCNYRMYSYDEYKDYVPRGSKRIVVIGKYLSSKIADTKNPCAFLPIYLVELR